jgi:hypothetical protein
LLEKREKGSKTHTPFRLVLVSHVSGEFRDGRGGEDGVLDEEREGSVQDGSLCN